LTCPDSWKRFMRKMNSAKMLHLCPFYVHSIIQNLFLSAFYNTYTICTLHVCTLTCFPSTLYMAECVTCSYDDEWKVSLLDCAEKLPLIVSKCCTTFFFPPGTHIPPELLTWFNHYNNISYLTHYSQFLLFTNKHGQLLIGYSSVYPQIHI
jgi:hypothetical protein